MKKNMSVQLLLIALIAASCYIISIFTACDNPNPTGPASEARITITATDNSLPADGVSSTVVTAYVKDPHGNPAEGPIYWTTNCGSLDKSSDTMSDGVSSITFTAPNYACSAVITADAVHAKKSITIECYSIDAYDIDVTANPKNIPADGYSTSTISAYVKDSRGLPVPDGTYVDFSTTGGTLSADSVTTESGRANVLLTSETVPKDVQVFATVGSETGSTWVYFYSTEVGWIELHANPGSNIPADGASSSIITATVRDVNGSPAEDGTTVYFATTWGNLSASSATTAKGVATVILYSTYDSYSDHTAVVTGVSGDKSASVSVGFRRYTGSQKTPIPTSTPSPTPPAARTSTPTPTPPAAHTSTPTPIKTATPTTAPTAFPALPSWFKIHQ